MTRIDDEGAAPVPPRGDRSEAALDAAFSAANVGMVAAIRRGFDLDAGLARIIGAPPQAGPPQAGPPQAGPSQVAARSLGSNAWRRLLSLPAQPESGWQRLDPYICTIDVGTQIARLRFRILDLVRQSQVGESAAVLLRVAASNLQDLHRGLEGKALSRPAAGSLLDAAGLALETASDVEASEIACPDKAALGEDSDYCAHCESTRNPLLSDRRVFRKRPSRLAGIALPSLGAVLLPALAIALSLLGLTWLHAVVVALVPKGYGAAEAAVTAVDVAVLGLLMFRVPGRLFRLFRRRLERVSAVTEAIKARAALRRQAADVSKAAAVLRRSVQPGDVERSDGLTYVTLLRAVAEQQRPPAGAAANGIDVLREELEGLRPSVMKLFDGTGDRSSCAPR
jgi:hypothetical protein